MGATPATTGATTPKSDARARGKKYRDWFEFTGVTGVTAPIFLEGQSSSDETFTNNTQSVAPLKTKDPIAESSAAVYDAVVSGTRSINGTTNFTRYEDEARNQAVNEALKLIKFATDVTATRYSGYVTKGKTDTEEVFTGFKVPVVLTSVSLSNPQGEEEATGSIAWTSSGSQPIDIKAKTWVEAMAQAVNE